MEIIAAPTDGLGVNYYSRNVLEAGGPMGFESSNEHATLPRTEMDWEIYPQGLYELLCRLHFEYRIPQLYITENGCAMPDELAADGKVHDTDRIDYLRGHFDAAARAIQAGVPLKGYFVWSLMDNFEWAWGFSKRFGLVWVDYETQVRTPKESAYWLRDLITTGVME
jgi:beta-glucosidase